MLTKRKLLKLAFKGLQVEREQIEQEISEIRAQLRRGQLGGKAVLPGRKNLLSVAARRAISEGMRAYWARRKKAV
ncbi:MAG: hypothetical protein HY644_13775 [Acidobacteria bacterium]|nr:hypothetical protein [Acidobacteriota bacterium]